MIDKNTLFKISYGLYVVTTREGEKDAGCIINTAQQVTDTPLRISITVNKQNYTHDMILCSRRFNLSVLDESATFDVFKHFGFQSGRNADKFAEGYPRTGNGVPYVQTGVNAVISAKVTQTVDCGTHTLFIAEVTGTMELSQLPSCTYTYYFDHIKPQTQASPQKKGWVCKICGYVYEGEVLPEDYICPLCKHGAADFEPLGG